MLALKERTECRIRTQALQVAGLQSQRNIEAAEAAEMRSFTSDVTYFQQNAFRKFLFKTGVPLLDVRRRRMLVEAEVTGKPSGWRCGEAVAGGQHGQGRTVGGVDLALDAI